MTEVSTMVDTIGADAGTIPTQVPFVGAYVSGTGDVPWDAQDLSRFPADRVVRIYQGSGTYPGIGGYSVLDVESEAVTVAQAASEIEKRVQNDYVWTIVYAGDENAEAVATAVKDLGVAIWVGHVYLWYANWNLSQVKAEALLGTEVHGMTCVAVQWASPTSNPNTIGPDTTMPLHELNWDLSVVDATRIIVPGKTVPAAPPAAQTIKGMVVSDPSADTFVAVSVTSTDNGQTWVKA